MFSTPSKKVESTCTQQKKCVSKIEVCHLKGKKLSVEGEIAGYHYFPHLTQNVLTVSQTKNLGLFQTKSVCR